MGRTRRRRRADVVGLAGGGDEGESRAGIGLGIIGLGPVLADAHELGRGTDKQLGLALGVFAETDDDDLAAGQGEKGGKSIRMEAQSSANCGKTPLTPQQGSLGFVSDTASLNYFWRSMARPSAILKGRTMPAAAYRILGRPAVGKPRPDRACSRSRSAFPSCRASIAPQLVQTIGARVWSADGAEYVDFDNAGGGVLLGHRDPFVVAAIRQARADNSARCIDKLRGEVSGAPPGHDVPMPRRPCSAPTCPKPCARP